jgi:hypothetical protein
LRRYGYIGSGGITSEVFSYPLFQFSISCALTNTVDVLLCVASFTVGGILICDTISEHYVVKILRERRSNQEKKDGEKA